MDVVYDTFGNSPQMCSFTIPALETDSDRGGGETHPSSNSQSTQTTRVNGGQRVRVPWIRVRGQETPYEIIPGRKGGKGEKVIVVGVKQVWASQDPPITVYSDEENDDYGLPKSAKKIMREETPDCELTLRYFHSGADNRNKADSVYNSSATRCVLTEDIGNARRQKTVRPKDLPFIVVPSESDKSDVCRSRMRSTISGEDESPLEIAESSIFYCDNEIGCRAVSSARKPRKSKAKTVIIHCDSDSDDARNSMYAKKRRPNSELTRECSASECATKDTVKDKIPSHCTPHENGSAEVNLMDRRTRVCSLRETYHEQRKLYSAGEGQDAGNQMEGRNRSDMRAFKYCEKNVLTSEEIVQMKNVVGEVPGTQVGDYFFYRMELFLVGIHCQCQSGIDFMPKSYKLNSFLDGAGRPVPVAISVVSCKGGLYHDTYEGGTLIYTGQGNINQDQEMKRGNLALKNSCDRGLSVRVTQAIEVNKAEGSPDFLGKLEFHPCSPSGFLYVYFGLYRVTEYYQENGKHGFKVWKFKLKRIAGQRDIPEVFRT